MCMKNKKEKIDKAVLCKIFKGCAYVLWFPLLLTVFTECLNGILTIVTADIFGKFADAVFALDFTLGVKNITILVICVVAVCMFVPVAGMLSDFFMLKKALQHDRMMLEFYLDKEAEKTRALEHGKWQYLLEDEPNTLRVQWMRVFGQLLALPVYGGYLIYCVGSVDRLLAVLMFILAMVRFTVPVVFKNKLVEYDKEEKNHNAKYRSFESDIAAQPYIVKNWKLEKILQNRMQELFVKYFCEKKSQQIVCQTLLEKVTEFVNSVTQLILITAGALLIIKAEITAGEFASMLVYFTMVQTILNKVGDIIQNCPLLMNAARMVSIIYQDQENVSGKKVEHVGKLTGKKISVKFSDKTVFENLDFSFTAGEKVGICGKNGSGKSTLCKILVSLLKGYEGIIVVDGENLRTVDMTEWRKKVTYVPQNPQVFRATVRENMVMGNKDVSKERMRKLIHAFGIDSIADRFIFTETELSGGEMQKISIIRGFLRNSEVLILDEPSNHLDKESVEVLKKYIEETKKTVLLISHDAMLLEVMDRRIYVN